jgi:signal transduction histidine kinase
MQGKTPEPNGHTGTVHPSLMSDMISSYDWSVTPLGHVAGWPDALKAAVRILVTSQFPMWMAWGPELTFLYNDAYARVTLGKKHPWALGQPVSKVWHEVWNEARPRIERVLKTGEASWDETLPLIVERSGYPEESYHTLSYSPLVGSDDQIEGVLCVVMEDTQRVLSERQLTALTTLAGTIVNANTKQEVFAAIERGLANQKDIPFSLVYLSSSGSMGLKLVASSGLEAGHEAAPLEIAEDSPSLWPIGDLISGNRAVTVENLDRLFPNLPAGMWGKPPGQARLVPIFRKGQERPDGVFIAALNPYRQFDSRYAGFLDLAAGQIAASIANAEANEAAREIDRARRFAWEVLEHVPDSFAALDRNYRITYMNSAAARLVAFTNRPHIGEVLWDIYPHIVGTEIERVFRHTMEQRIPVEFEHLFHGENVETWYQFYIYPQPGEGVIVYLRDTTETRKTEQALRRSEQLAAAGRLAASIAHEINNPLEAVTNLLFLAKTDQGLSTSTKDLLEVADKELQRLSHITARSLRFYRQRTAPALTALDEVIDSVLYFHDPSIRLFNTQIDRRYRAAPPVLCQPGEIQQVFTNLISNALDALKEKGHLVLAVRPAKDLAGREGVRVTIADDGSGMDANMFDRLFHPFVTTKGEAGTGLGLWVSKGILDKHHAKIVVRSKPGRGTVFRLFFPLDAITPAPQPGQ